MMPHKIASTVMILVNFSISIDRVVCMFSVDEARPAILPMTVLSPVFMTTPTPVPAVHIVPKNATFGDSKMFVVF